MIYAYTDGATSNNEKGKGVGGIGWVILSEGEQELKHGSAHLDNTTNNECELTALIVVCEHLKAMMGPVDVALIYSDSAYCVNCYKDKWWVKWEQNGWVNSKKQPVQNKELWEKLIPYFRDVRFNFRKVKGHEDNFWNNYVDELAVKAKEIDNA